jgi:hypothetical protein
MLLSFRQILSLIDASDISGHASDELSTCFKKVRMLRSGETTFDKGTVYVCYSSQLPDKLPLYDIGLIFINDCLRDFSDCTLKWIELKETVSLATIVDLINAQLSIAENESQALEGMLSDLFSDKTISESLDLSYDILHNPIILFVIPGRTDVVLQAYKENAPAEIVTLNSAMKEEPENPDLLNVFLKSVEKLESSSVPLLLDDGVNYPGKRRITSLFWSQKYSDCIGAIALYEVNRAFEERDFIYFSLVNRIINEKLQNTNFQSNYCKILHEQYIHDLINGKAITADSNWLSVISGTRYRNFHIAVLNAENADSKELSSARFDLSFLLFPSLTVRRGSYLVILFNPKRDEELAVFGKHLLDIGKKYQITIGVSDRFDDISLLRQYYRQAKKARDVGLSISKDNIVSWFSELRSHILLSEIPKEIDLTMFICDDYQKIKQYDQKKGMEYCKTMRSYLAHNANRKAVCNALHIHRNTLVQRIEKIEQILGKPISDNEFLFDMYLSAIIDEYLQLAADSR